MTFQAAALAAFATASNTALNGGTIELLDGSNAVLGAATLDTPAGTSAGAVTTFSGFPKTVTASASGTVASARIRTSATANYKTGITVGIPASGAQVIVNNGVGTLVVTAGQTVQIAASPTLTHAG